MSNQVLQKTPWQIKNDTFDYLSKIEEIKNYHIFFARFGFYPNALVDHYNKSRAQTDALITVLAILRYKYDTGQLPESLDKLIVAGYLKAIPKDPYSDGSLIYKITEDGFTLYSVGEDFTDDGGIIDRDKVSWREISLNLHVPDIVYWPVEIIEPKPVDFGMGGFQ